MSVFEGGAGGIQDGSIGRARPEHLSAIFDVVDHFHAELLVFSYECMRRSAVDGAHFLASEVVEVADVARFGKQGFPG
jgi:hypothetical protein